MSTIMDNMALHDLINVNMAQDLLGDNGATEQHFNILLEDNGNYLLEDGGFLLLEH